MSQPQSGHSLPAQCAGQLNPRWVEWLMGFADGWTSLSCTMTVEDYPYDPHWYDWEPDIPRVATGVQGRVAELTALGNAVDPYQPLPILQALYSLIAEELP